MLSLTRKAALLYAVTITLLMFSASFAAAQAGGDSKVNLTFDPGNKQQVSGTIHLASVRGNRLQSSVDSRRALINIKNAFKKWTQVDVVLDEQVRLSSPAIMKYPFLYLSYDGSLELTDSEKENLSKYLKSGGLLMLEDTGAVVQSANPATTSRNNLPSLLGISGRISPISNSHDLYHVFFDFNDGPPQGGEVNMNRANKTLFKAENERRQAISSAPGTDVMNSPVRSLDGININGKLAVIHSRKSYVVKWIQASANDPQLRFAVNAILYGAKNF